MLCRDLTFQYRKRRVLQGVSFNIERGEIVGILGRNGAGKSTLLRILCGLLRADSGTVTNLYSLKQTGVVFQECSLDTKLSAMMNLELSARVYGKQCETKIREGLAYFNLQSAANHIVKTYSGGMKRQLELLRATLHDPDWMLMDEPSAGLDSVAFAKFWEMLQRHKTSRGMSALIATHRVDEAEKCDRLLVMHEGKIIADDTPQALKNRVHGDRIKLTFRAGTLLSFQQMIESAILSPQRRLGSSAPQVLDSSLRWNDNGINDNCVELVCLDGPQMVPSIVENLPAGIVESIHVRKPSLADAFLQITGANL